MPSSGSEEDRLSRIPQHLRIRLLHDCNEFVVIDKPCNLRSVPGHAKNPPPSLSSSRKRPHSQKEEVGEDEEGARRRTAQEAWVLAIKSFGDDGYSTTTTTRSRHDDNNESNSHHYYLYRLATTITDKRLESIPRKYKIFRRYIERNQKAVIGDDDNDNNDKNQAIILDRLSTKMFEMIQERQKPLMNLPEPTKLDDSALGQIMMMMGYGRMNNGDDDIQSTNHNLRDDSPSSSEAGQLFVVHRLDCETSGTMVFAKNQAVASSLSKAWRERGEVSKHYLAVVSTWPPYHDDNKREGVINIPLSPSDERLKWKVDLKNGKPSTTEWKVQRLFNNNETQNTETKISENNPVLLELKPITGRTHQLRIHCAQVGSGIQGDSLYGDDKVDFDPKGCGKLKLHAWKLAFPHPNGTGMCEFSSCPTWMDEGK